MSKIKKIKPSTIRRALRLHEEWLEYNDLCDPELPKGKEIVLTNEIIQKINFTGCNLFAGADLRNLDASNLDFSKNYFFGVDFSGTNFEGANFENSNFEGLMAGSSKFNATIFCYANFTNANFANSCFTCASFISAYFRNAIFRNANFKDANFNSADFKYSRFMDVEFDNAVFDGIQLKHTITEGLLGFQIVSCQLNSSEQNRVIQYWPKLDIVTTGCFSGTMDELKVAIKKTHKNRPEIRKKYNLAIDYIETMVKLG